MRIVIKPWGAGVLIVALAVLSLLAFRNGRHADSRATADQVGAAKSSVASATGAPDASASEETGKGYTLIHGDQGAMNDYIVIPDCGTSASCGAADVDIAHTGDVTTLTTNKAVHPITVNAIAQRKFTDVTPDGSAIQLTAYRDVVSMRLPRVPDAAAGGEWKTEGAQLVTRYWDGSGKTWKSDKQVLEGSLVWALNPSSPDYGKIQVYSGSPSHLIDTGISLKPDTAWHTFEVRSDFRTQTYAGVRVDNTWRPLNGVPLSRVKQPSWGDELSLMTTIETSNIAPAENAGKPSHWQLQCKDERMYRLS